MEPIRMIYKNLPSSLEIPEELRNKSAEIIIYPLEAKNIETKAKKRPYGLAKGKLELTEKFFEPLPKSILSDFGIE
jgi:hypothetical protein